MEGLQIRPATPSDAGDVARLLGQLGVDATPDDAGERLARVTGGRATVLLACRDGAVVGLATAHILDVLNRPRPVTWLTLLVVDEAVRGTGVGRALVEAVEAFAREAGCERLSVTTHEHLTGARAFYPAVGLPPTGRRFGKMLT